MIESLQPITPEEVEKAATARISPLALSMVKPPDPELLQSMSLKDQKDYMARWATETLQQLGSRPISTGGTRSKPGSDGEEERDGSSKGEQYFILIFYNVSLGSLFNIIHGLFINLEFSINSHDCMDMLCIVIWN